MGCGTVCRVMSPVRWATPGRQRQRRHGVDWEQETRRRRLVVTQEADVLTFDLLTDPVAAQEAMTSQPPDPLYTSKHSSLNSQQATAYQLYTRFLSHLTS